MMNIYEKLVKKEAKLGVIGLGYVGLPIALEFARTIKVVGFDINQERVELMKNNIDPSEELESSDFDGCDILFTANTDDLKDVDFFIIAVPTPIDEHNLPDLRPVLGASRTVGGALSEGNYVVYESTVYPGCTEEDCIPVLEEVSGLKFKTDFKVGYSPERINPGDKEHTLRKIIKVAAGCDEESSELVAKTYELVVDAGVYRAKSIKVAEAAKIIENTQRDVNIALMNELSMIFNRVGINTFDVLEAAGTKWNFLKFFPGLVGGHCIGVDPYYLTHKARQLGYHSKVITSGRSINDEVGAYVARETVKKIVAKGGDISKAKVLVMGATFKENVSDIRNSKVVDVIRELESFGVRVEVVDPHASSNQVNHEYGFELAANIGSDYDAVILAVNHTEYLGKPESYFQGISKPNGVFVDVKGVYKDQIKQLSYWSL